MKSRDERAYLLSKKFENEMTETSRLGLLKKCNHFLEKMSEYVKLETIGNKRQTRDLPDILNFEIANDSFLLVEDLLTDLISKEPVIDNTTAASRTKKHSNISNAAPPVAKKSLRNKTVVLHCQNDENIIIPPKRVHWMILIKAYSTTMICAGLHRNFKMIRIGAVTEISIRLENLVPVGPVKILGELNPLTQDTIYNHISEYLKSLYAYQRGIEMGKYLLFLNQFDKSLTFLQDKISGGNIERQIDCLIGDSILNSSSLLLSGAFSGETRLKLLEKWKLRISSKFALSETSNSEIFLTESKFLPSLLLENDIISSFKYNFCFVDPFEMSEILLETMTSKTIKIIQCIERNYTSQLYQDNSKKLLKGIDAESEETRQLCGGFLFDKATPLSYYYADSISKDCLCIDLTLSESQISLFFFDIIMEKSNPVSISYRKKARMRIN